MVGAAPRPVDVGTIGRRMAALEGRVRALDASRRLSFAGAQVTASNTGFGIGTSWGTMASTTFTLPSWAETGLVLVTATSAAYWQDFFLAYYMRIGVGGVYGGETAAVYGREDSVSATTAWSGEVSGAGSSVTLNVQGIIEDMGQTDPPYPPMPGNVATLNAMVLMLR